MSPLQQEIVRIVAGHERPLKQACIVRELHDNGYLAKQPSVARALKTLVARERLVRTVCKEYHVPGLNLTANEHARQKLFREYPPGHVMRTDAVTRNAAILMTWDVTPRGLKHAEFVNKYGCREIGDAVKAGALSMMTAIKIIALSEDDDDQRSWLKGTKFEIKQRVNRFLRAVRNPEY